MRDLQLKSWLTATALTMSATSGLLAQTITGSINGMVTDPGGAVVANATVIAKNVATGVETRTVTNSAGDYNIRFLQIGQYTITVQQTGFSEQKLGPITLEVDQAAKVDAKLSIGSEATQVNVSSELQPILDSDNSTVASTFSASTIENLPLNGRNFSAITQFIPGAVATDPQGMVGQNAIERSTNQGGTVAVNGNRNQTNDYLLDGIEINETINNTIGYNPSPDALGNLKVITSNADAEYGNVNGGEVLAQLKSGSNKLHGSAFGFLENANLDANTWANNLAGTPRQPFTQTIFGGTLGGPIIKDRLFFFVDYEGTRFHQGGTSAVSVIPAAMRQGDFSSIPYPLYHFVNGAGLVPYVNNQVPVTNPAAIYLFAHPELYPLPNKAGTTGTFGVHNNYQGSTHSDEYDDQGDVKIDYTISRMDQLSASYSQSNAGDTQTQTPLDITFPTSNLYPFKSVAINYVHTFSPSIVNEFRGGYSRVYWNQGVPTDLTGQIGLNGNSLLGINAKQPYPGFAALSFTAGSANASNVPTTIGTTGGASSLIDNTFTYGDDLTIERGKQTFKMGVEILRYQQNNFYPGNDGAMGTFGYSGNFTGGTAGAGYSVADFVNNEAYSANVGAIAGRTGQRQYRDAAFIQDDWKLTPTLTANVGLRYEYDQPIYEVNNKEANVDLATGVVYLAGERGAGGVFGDDRALYHPVYKNFMPRVGFSWQANPRVVFRGGYGITNYLEGTGANLRLTYNPPYQGSFEEAALTPTETSAGTPLTVQQGFSSSATNLNQSTGTYRAWQSNLKPAFIQEFTFSNEIQLDNQTSLSMAYLGQLGQHLIDARAANQVQQGQTIAPFAGLVGQGGAIVETASDAVMKYNAAQVQVRHRQSNGLEYTVNYTWSHSLTNSSGFFGVSGVNGASPYWQDAYNGHADYGNAGFDVRNNLSATMVYQIPFGRGQRFGGNVNHIVDEVAGGWKLSGDAIVYSGLPVTINAQNLNSLNNRAERANQYRPLIVHGRSLSNWFGTDATALPCVPTATNGLLAGQNNGSCAYGQPGVNEFGTAENNTERAPGYEQIDITAGKAFAITESQHIEYRADFFNVGNIASYSNPDNTITDSTFGKITDVRSIPRTIQMSLHYSF